MSTLTLPVDLDVVGIRITLGDSALYTPRPPGVRGGDLLLAELAAISLCLDDVVGRATSFHSGTFGVPEIATVTSIRYNSPLEIVLVAGSATTVVMAILRALRDFGPEYRERRALEHTERTRQLAEQELESFRRDLVALLRQRLNVEAPSYDADDLLPSRRGDENFEEFHSRVVRLLYVSENLLRVERSDSQGEAKSPNI